MLIEEKIPLLEEILSEWQSKIGADYLGYKNHIYRMVHFCLALQGCNEEQREKIIIAACFHDLGIWTHHTFDYLKPSVELAKAYLQKNHKQSWNDDVGLLIDCHHKMTVCKDNVLAELFRQADLIDVSLGMIRFGLSKQQVKLVKSSFPNAGFHKKLVKLTFAEFKKHPLKPLPVMKW